MKTYLLLFLCLFTIISPKIFSQTDSTQSASSSFLISDDSILVENSKPVSMAGAISLSFIFPGTGLFLSENYGAAAAYLGIGSALYVTGVIFLLSGEKPNESIYLPLFALGGFIHLASIIHTVIATNGYNENVFPFVSYNGKSYQVGFSIKL